MKETVSACHLCHVWLIFTRRQPFMSALFCPATTAQATDSGRFAPTAGGPFPFSIVFQLGVHTSKNPGNPEFLEIAERIVFGVPSLQIPVE